MKYELRKFNGARDWGWITEHVPMKRVEDTCGFIMFKKGKHVAAIVFDNFLHNCVSATIIVQDPMALRHGILEQAFEFAFSFAHKEWMYVLVAANNTKSLKLAKHLNFVEKTRMPDAFADGVDMILMSLHRDQCAFVQPKDEVA